MRTTIDNVTPELMLQAYAAGIFPMAEARDDPNLHWIDPERRGILPLDRFHIARSLRKRLRAGQYAITVDQDFAGVLDGCAERAQTWINAVIRKLMLALHRDGHAHSLEVWEDDALVGGVYGVTLGGAFFGESMFSRRRDASKIALAYLIDRLRAGGFVLFDTQFLTSHLQSLGGIEISRGDYHVLLAQALRREADFDRPRLPPRPQELLQRNTQIS